jgi:hypothetical protein
MTPSLVLQTHLTSLLLLTTAHSLCIDACQRCHKRRLPHHVGFMLTHTCKDVELWRNIALEDLMFLPFFFFSRFSLITQATKVHYSWS